MHDELLVLPPLVLCRLRLPLHGVGVALLHLPLLLAAHDPLEACGRHSGRVLIDLRALGDLLPRAGDVALDAARVGPREGPAAVVARPRPAFLAALLGLVELDHLIESARPPPRCVPPGMANGGPQHIGPELEAALLKRARRGAPILVQAPKRPQSEWAGFGAVSEAEHGRSGFELAEHGTRNTEHAERAFRKTLCAYVFVFVFVCVCVCV